MNTIDNEITKGVAYSTMARFLIIAIQAVTSIYIARLLNSSDYGLVSFGVVFINFLAQFSDFGIGSALVQKKNISQSFLNTAFTIKNALAVLLALIALIISFIVPVFYNYPHIEWVIRLFALNFILSSIGFVSVALLKREMDFLHPNIALLISTIFGSATSVTLAYMGYGFWCLVWSNILSTTIQAIAIMYFKPFKLRYELDASAMHEMWRFGSYVFGSGLLIYALFNGATFIVGTVSGPVILGYFSLALDWGTKVPILLSQTILTVLFPAFTKLTDDKEKFNATYMKTIKYVAFFSILANMTLLFVSEDFLRTILGNNTDKWMPSLRCLRILLLYGIIRAILEPIGSVIMALGETKILLRANLFSAGAQVLLLYPTLLSFGIEGVAWLILGSYSLQFITYISFLHKQINIHPLLFARSIAAPIMSSISFLLGYLLFEWFNFELTTSMTIAKSCIYAFLYIIAFGLFTNFQFIYDLKLCRRS